MMVKTQMEQLDVFGDANKTSAKATRNYKDTFFRYLFKEKEGMLELYNAIFGENENDVSVVEDITLSGVLFQRQKMI